MVKNNWSYDDILKDIQELESMLENEPDYVKRGYIAKVLDRTMYLFKNDTMSKFSPNDSLTTGMYDLNLDYFNYTRYYSLLASFYELTSSFEDRMDETESLLFLNNDLNDDYDISNEECITLVHDFFMNTDSIFSNLFATFFNDSRNAIKFVNEDELLNSCNYGGLTFFIDILKRNYITVLENQGIFKISALAHECGHAVANLLEPKSFYYRQDVFLSEFPALFFELAFMDEIMKKKDSFISALFSFEKYAQIIDSLDSIGCHHKFLEEFRKNNYKGNMELLRILKEKYGAFKPTVYNIVNTRIDEDGTYVIGYMIALELLNIYRQDKKEALSLLRRILSMYQEDSLITLNTCMPKVKKLKYEISSIESTMREELEKSIKK